MSSDLREQGREVFKEKISDLKSSFSGLACSGCKTHDEDDVEAPVENQEMIIQDQHMSNSVNIHPFILTNLNLENDSMRITASNTNQKSTDYETVQVKNQSKVLSDESCSIELSQEVGQGNMTHELKPSEMKNQKAAHQL